MTTPTSELPRRTPTPTAELRWSTARISARMLQSFSSATPGSHTDPSPGLPSVFRPPIDEPFSIGDLLSFFRCQACANPLPAFHFGPVCKACLESLLPAPELCPSCAGPNVGCGDGKCSKPWAQGFRLAGIESVHAAYLLVGPGYRLLRSWKIRRSRPLNRQILSPDRLKSFQEAWISGKGAQPEVIVPVPQGTSRAWKMGGSPALLIANWLSRSLGIPVATPLEVGHRLRQAERSLNERASSTLTYSPNASAWTLADHRVILVDDFLTTGKTMQTAARALRALGCSRITAFCLGIRPSLSAGKTQS